MKIIYGDSPITFGDSLVITVVSMLTVFLVLILISFILSLLKYLPSEKKVTENKKDAFSVSSENSASEGKKIGPEDIKDEKMLAAVAAAVIDAAGEIDNAYIKVRSIREVNQ